MSCTSFCSAMRTSAGLTILTLSSKLSPCLRAQCTGELPVVAASKKEKSLTCIHVQDIAPVISRTNQRDTITCKKWNSSQQQIQAKCWWEYLLTRVQVCETQTFYVHTNCQSVHKGTSSAGAAKCRMDMPDHNDSSRIFSNCSSKGTKGVAEKSINVQGKEEQSVRIHCARRHERV